MRNFFKWIFSKKYRQMKRMFSNTPYLTSDGKYYGKPIGTIKSIDHETGIATVELKI